MMKVLAAVLLLISAAEAIYNLVGLPDARFQQVEHILKDAPFAAKPSKLDATASLGNLFKNVQLNDFFQDASNGSNEDGGSGVNPGGPDDIITQAVTDMVRSLHKIMPAIKTLKEARDKQNHEYAMEFVSALWHLDEDQVKAVLGRHVVSLHGRCRAIKLAFAKRVHAAGLLDALGHDDLDFTEVMGKVLEYAEQHEADVFEAFVYMAHKHGIQNRPGVQVIMTIGGLVADAACEVKMDGLVERIGELIHQGDPHADFEKHLGDNVISFLYNKKNKKCTGDLLQSLQPGKGLKEKILSLIFERCKEVRLVRYAVSTVMDAIQLGKKVAVLQLAAHKRTMAIAHKVGELMQAGLVDEAHEVVGDFILTELRRALLVGIAVHKTLESSHPKPTGPRPSGPNPSPSGPKPSGTPHSPDLHEKKRASLVEDEFNFDLRG